MQGKVVQHKLNVAAPGGAPVPITNSVQACKSELLVVGTVLLPASVKIPVCSATAPQQASATLQQLACGLW